MGKQKIERLLTQLKENQQRDIQNAAAIYTVAQSAVNELAQTETAREVVSLPDGMPLQLTKSDLVQRYGSYNGCRQAAKKQGISFSRSPKWSQLVAAFNYAEACQACVRKYVALYPSADLKGAKLTLML